MVVYICSDCGKKTKESDLQPLYHDDGRKKWVCKACYKTYPDEDLDDDGDTKRKCRTCGDAVPASEIIQFWTCMNPNVGPDDKLPRIEPEQDACEYYNRNTFEDDEEE